MTPMRKLREVLTAEIDRSFFGFAPTGQPEQRALYAALRGYLVALVLNGAADDVLLERPGISARAFLEHARAIDATADHIAVQLAAASRRSPLTSDLATSSE